MRRTLLAAASVAALACLGACGNDSDAASDAVVVAAPTPTPVPTPMDPFAWSDVKYEDYLDAAQELGLRPDVLVPEAGFLSGLSALCRTSADEMVTMRSSHRSYTEDAATYSTAKYLADEVGLRIGLACPQRMSDWTAAADEPGDEKDGEHDGDDGVSAVTDEDLAKAAAVVAAASSAPEYEDESEAGDDSDVPADPSPSPTPSS